MKTRSKPMFHVFTLFAILASLLGSALIVTPAYAASLVVDSVADTTAGDGVCTLREAITNANSNAAPYGDCTAGAGADTITFNVSGTIILGSALPWITDDLSIDGSGQSITISGNNATWILDVEPSKTVSLKALTIANGSASSNAGIYNQGALTISNSTFSNNNATTIGGGIYNTAAGTLTIYNSSFSNNSAGTNAGGGIYNGGTLNVSNSTFSGNSAAWGSGIYNQGTLNMMNTILANSGGSEDCYNIGLISTNTNNLIETNGPGGNMCGAPTVTGDPMLGALANNGGSTWTFALLPGSPAVDAGDDVTCTVPSDQRGVPHPLGARCDIGSYEQRPVRYVAKTGSDTGNDCTNSASPCFTVSRAVSQATSGDSIHIDAGTYAESNTFNDLEVIGAGMNQTILDGGASNRVIYVGFGKTASLADLTIQNGSSSSGRGGGIYSMGPLTLMRVKVTGNSAVGGGGISSEAALTITDSIVSANTATDDGTGGGIFVNTSETVNLTNVTISGNTTSTLSYSGGVHIQGSPTANLTNVTISGNTAGSPSGISIGGGTVSILNSTIANNHLTSGSGGGILNYATLKIKNTIVAGNDGDECSNGGTWNSQGYNLSSDLTCGFTNTGDQQNTDPLLAALADNGGYTQTHALLSGSPAIDAGDNTTCAVSLVNNLDQRGIARPQDGDGNGSAICDIGAFEARRTLTTLNFASQGSYDGWILETGEKTSKGGTKNSTSSTIRLGDDKTKKQYRGILSFNTSSLSDTAIITKVTLKVRKQGIAGGGNPVTTFKGFMADIKKGYFGATALQAADFQTAASKTYGPFKIAISGVWYNINLTSGQAYINKLSTSSGLTQIRLRFYLDDNNNTTANYLSLYSGSVSISAYRPQLVIEYYVP